MQAGEATGWNAAAHRSIDHLKIQERTLAAIQKAKRGREPREIPPGQYPVVLEPAAAERILTAAETLTWLEGQLAAMESPPADLLDLPDGASRAQRLLETACEMELEPGVVVQWFAIRLEPPER